MFIIILGKGTPTVPREIINIFFNFFFWKPALVDLPLEACRSVAVNKQKKKRRKRINLVTFISIRYVHDLFILLRKDAFFLFLSFP